MAIPEFDLYRSPAQLAEFDWIVGPVLSAYVWSGSPLVIVYQGHKAYAVVNRVTHEYLGCCPTFNHAIKFLEAQK